MADIEELIERLQFIATAERKFVDDVDVYLVENVEQAATVLSAQQREIAELREALTDIQNGDEPRWEDRINHGACKHGKSIDHDYCVTCIQDFAEAALNKQESLG